KYKSFPKNKRRGQGPAVEKSAGCADQPNRRSTLFWDWAASESAVSASDCRVCSASRLAPSWLVSASVRLPAPVCSVFMVVEVKLCRIWITDRLVPNEAAWFCRVVNDAVNWLAALASEVLVWKLADDWEMPRPAELNVAPESASDDVRLTLKTTCRLWP